MLCVDVHHDVTRACPGLKVLRAHVDGLFREHLIDAREHSRNVAVNVQQAVFTRMSGQCNFGEVDRRERRSVVAVADQLFRDLAAYVLLRFNCAATDVGRENDVVEECQRRDERIIVR